MQITNRETFTYPLSLSERWKDEIFKPTVDHKFQLLLRDGNTIEAGVFELSVDGKKEVHACVSTQAGCKFACAMCSSGKNGFTRNLTDSEIQNEIQLLSSEVGVKTFDHVVFMGIGEPLDNYDNFVATVREILITNPDYAGRLSFATVGLPERLRNLLREDLPNFRMLWISLHAPTDEKRKLIMPVNRAYPIQEILDAAQEFAESTTTEVWINYLLFRGFNDSREDAKSLVRLLRGTKDIFSVMIAEPNNDLPEYEGADIVDLKRFEGFLREGGMENRISRFIAAGKLVDAGCGEFVYTPK